MTAELVGAPIYVFMRVYVYDVPLPVTQTCLQVAYSRVESSRQSPVSSQVASQANKMFSKPSQVKSSQSKYSIYMRWNCNLLAAYNDIYIYAPVIIIYVHHRL